MSYMSNFAAETIGFNGYPVTRFDAVALAEATRMDEEDIEMLVWGAPKDNHTPMGLEEVAAALRIGEIR